MKKLYAVFTIVSMFLFTPNVFAQDASVIWVLNNTTQLTSSSVGNLTGSAESISSGSGQFGMSVFDYSNDGQRLWEGTAGWIAGSEEATRYIQFNALPVSGNSFNVTNVSFNYGAAGIDHNMQSNAYYSTDGWVTRTLLNLSPLEYPGSGMSTFTQNVSATVASGTTFSVRIYPYAIVNSSPMRPTFAVHNSVGVRGTTSAKKNCIIELTNVSSKWGKSVLLTARLQELGAAGNTNLPGRKISFSRECDTTETGGPDEIFIGSGTTDANGVVSVLYDIPASTKTRNWIADDTSSTKSVIKAEFTGDADYNAQSDTGTLTILKHVTSLLVADTTAVFGQPVLFSATLTDNDNDGKGVSDQELKFYKISPGTREGDTARVYIGSDTTDANGFASLMMGQISDTLILPMKISVSFAGDVNYSPKSGTGVLTILKKSCTIQVTDVSSKWGRTVLLTAKLFEPGLIRNTEIPDQELKFFKVSPGTRESDTCTTCPGMGGIIFIGSGTTDAKGIVNLYYDILPSTKTRNWIADDTSSTKIIDTIRVEFAGDVNYQARTDMGKLTIEKHITSLLVADTTAVFGKSVLFSATLTDNDNDRKGVSDQELKFYKISPGTREGDTTKVYIGSDTTDANGFASITITEPEDGHRGDTIIIGNILVSFAGDLNYLSKRDTSILTTTLKNGITLISPLDGEVIGFLPEFKWLRPESDTTIYSLRIVELLGNQSPDEAILENELWYVNNIDTSEAGNLIDTLAYQYPSSAKKFVEGNTYAWQMRSYLRKTDPTDTSGTTTIAYSKVWKFIIKDQTPPLVILQQPPPYQFRKHDLWKASIENTTKANIDVYLQGSLSESTQGIVLKDTSKALSLSPGINLISYLNFDTLRVNSIFDRWGLKLLFGSGDYTACIQVKKVSGEELGSACINQVVDTTATAKKSCAIQVTDAASKWGRRVLLTAKLFEPGLLGNTDIPDQELKFFKISPGTREGDTSNIFEEYINSGITDAKGITNLYYDILPRTKTRNWIADDTSSTKIIDTIRVEFAGDVNYQARSDMGKLTIEKHTTSLAVASTIFVRGAQPILIGATLTDNDETGKGVANQELKFYKISPGTREGDTTKVYLGSDTTDANGVASITIKDDDETGDTIIIGNISVSFAGDANYIRQSGKGTITIYVVGVENDLDIPTKFALSQNYPNPFNPTSTIRFAIPKTSFVKMSIYDILGREVKNLVNEEKTPGFYEVVFDANEFASGIYFYKISAGDFTQSKKMILMK